VATSEGVLNGLIWKVGFHNKKTTYIKKVAEILMEEYGGDIPHTVEGMMKLPGVGPKMVRIVTHYFKTNTTFKKFVGVDIISR